MCSASGSSFYDILLPADRRTQLDQHHPTVTVTSTQVMSLSSMQQPAVHRFSRAGEVSGYPAVGHREPVYSWAKSSHHEEDTESVWAGVTIVAKRPAMKATRVAETRSATDNNTKAGKLARHSETRVATKRRSINKIATKVLDGQLTIKEMEARENRLNSRVSDLKHDHAIAIGSNSSPVSGRTDRAKSLQSPNCSTRSVNVAHGQNNKTNTSMVPVSKPESSHHKPTVRCNDTTNSHVNDTPQTNTNTQEDSGEILTLFDAMKGIKIQPPAYWIGCSYIFFSSSNAIGIIIRQTGVHPKICKGSRKIILELSLPSMKSKTRTIVLINSAKDNSFKSHKVTFRDIPTGSVTQQTLRLRVWVKKGLLSKELLEEWTVPMQRCEPIIEHTDWQRCQF